MRSTVLVALIATIALPTAAGADASGKDVRIDSFAPALDTKGFTTLDGSDILGPGQLSFGLTTSWAKRPLAFESEGATFALTDVLVPTLTAAVGMPLANVPLEFALALPFAVISGDRGPDTDNGTPGDPNDDSRYRFDAQGLGDLELRAKWRLRSTSRRSGLGAALVGGISLPTASSEAKFAGTSGLTARIALVLERRLGRLRVGVNAGAHLVPGSSFVDERATPTATHPFTGGTFESGSALPGGVAFSLPLSPGRIEYIHEVVGALALDGAKARVETTAAMRVYLAGSSFFSFGVGTGLLARGEGTPTVRGFASIVFEPALGDRDGDGLKDDVDRCPNDPEDFDDFEDADGCPDFDNDRDRIPDTDDSCPNVPENRNGFEDEDGCPDAASLDRDGDGILDEVDQCPDDPEDKDDFEDSDGCPDLDNDRDGILDVDDLCPNDPEDLDGWEDEDGCPDNDNDKDRILDKDDTCPNEPETYNTVDDKDGCPDRGPVTLTDIGIEVLETIYFEYDSAVIKKESHNILRAVAKTLDVNPDIALIEIQGHTDERGSADYNRKLSQARSESVLAFLVNEGISPKRLAAQGYGEDQPLDLRHNAAAWAKNRRVEFIILRRAGDGRR